MSDCNRPSNRVGDVATHCNVDTATRDATGDPSGVLTNRKSEHPYHDPPEMFVVEPGHPLPPLDTSKKYLWAVDKDGRVLVAPEVQKGFPRKVKHGDLVPGPGGKSRGEARTGGEFNYSSSKGRWEMNNDSSYVFARTDGQKGNGANLAAARTLLEQAGTDVSNIEARNSHGA